MGDPDTAGKGLVTNLGKACRFNIRQRLTAGEDLRRKAVHTGRQLYRSKMLTVFKRPLPDDGQIGKGFKIHGSGDLDLRKCLSPDLGKRLRLQDVNGRQAAAAHQGLFMDLYGLFADHKGICIIRPHIQKRPGSVGVFSVKNAVLHGKALIFRSGAEHLTRYACRPEVRIFRYHRFQSGTIRKRPLRQTGKRLRKA